MRTTILLCIASLLTCCVHAQDSAKLAPKPKSKGEYIILKDSTKLTGNVYRSGDGIKLNGRYYEYNQLLGYKENDSYRAVLNDGLYNVWSTGKIQAYSKWQTIETTGFNPNGATPPKWETYDTNINLCFLKKDAGQLMFYTTQSLLNMVSDNEAAVKEFHQCFKKINNNIPTDALYLNLRKVLAVYNGGEFMEY